METFNFFKLWKTSPIPGNVIPPPEYDDEDAFFDLELNYETKNLKNITKLPITNTIESDEDEEESFENSPISFLKSPPKFPLFFKFGKTKITGDESPATASPVFRRNNSNTSRKSQGPKEMVCKYLRLIKVRVISGERVSRERVSRERVSREGMRSPSLRIVSRPLGKSRSAAPAAGVWNSGGDSVLHSDGIQSAILHCKRSYNSSRDLSVLSRSVSEPVVSANRSRFSIEEKKRISI